MADVKTAAAEGRRQKKARQTRRRILAAAAELFTRQGYAATTIQQVAEQADVAWQTVYSVFGTKAAILSAVFDVAVAGDDEPAPVAERPFVQAIKDAADPPPVPRASSASSSLPPPPIPRLPRCGAPSRTRACAG